MRRTPEDIVLHTPSLATDDEICQARELYGSDDIEIDEGAQASRADDGVWVAAWVWLSASDREGIS